jgi:hypothetical protein
MYRVEKNLKVRRHFLVGNLIGDLGGYVYGKIILSCADTRQNFCLLCTLKRVHNKVFVCRAQAHGKVFF